MNPQLWERVEGVLQEALALEPSRRREFVEAIPDAWIRSEVASLLSADGDGLEENLQRAISTTATRLIDGRASLPDNSEFGHYRVLRLLGSGGSSQVFLAEDLLQERKVALKFLPPDFNDDVGWVRRFEREARAASALNHPNIVTIYEIDNVDGRWFMALEYVPGESLQAKISRGPIPVVEALQIAEQIASALSETHQNGILHRDIKPANIMLRSDGLAKLVDFGIARVDPMLFTGSQTTHSGKLLGTPSYMSPEQAKGLPLTAGSDLWSMGAVLYEMVTGKRAFRGSDTPDILLAILSRRPPLPSSRVPSVPAGLDRLIMKLLSPSPAARYRSAEDVRLSIEELRSSLTAGPVHKSWRRLSSLFD